VDPAVFKNAAIKISGLLCLAIKPKARINWICHCRNGKVVKKLFSRQILIDDNTTTVSSGII